MEQMVALLIAAVLLSIVCFPVWFPFFIAALFAPTRAWRRAFIVGLVIASALMIFVPIAGPTRPNPFGDDVAGNMKGAALNLKQLFWTSWAYAGVGLLSAIPARYLLTTRDKGDRPN
jgi:hypothetical protein